MSLPSSQAAPDGGAATILIVEDNPIDRDLFVRLLQSNHHRMRCLECDRGKNALERVREAHPDCVLLDLNLPDIDGLDVLRSIIREPDPCPVVVMTAYGNEEIAVEAMKSGAADYVVKGAVTAENLSRVIENALERRSLHKTVEAQRRALEDRNRELEAAVERYRELAEAMPQVVWTADHPAGAWDYVNERWPLLTGDSAITALGTGWLNYIDAEDRDDVGSAWGAAIAAGRPMELEFRLRVSGNGSRWQLMRAVPLWKKSIIQKWIGTLTDVDSQRRTEQLLHQRQKLESIGILAAGVAHDFNNLLVGVVGGASFALETLPRNHELRPMIDNVLRAGERASDLTRQLLAYAGKSKVEASDVSLDEALRTTWELLQASIPRSIQIHLTVPPSLPPVRTDPGQLQQVMMNLLLNAAEAIPDSRHGLITVRAEEQALDTARAGWSSDLAPGRYVMLEVRDNGDGIAPDALHKIFDPFFTTKFTGRGLGLAAVQGIVHSNGGSIEVDSTPGNGAAFRVFLPVAKVRPHRSMAAAASTAKDEAPAARILVVDDEPVVRNVAQTALARAGHSVSLAGSGEEALQEIRADGEEFSLVVLDFNMPGLNGEQTFDAIHSLQPDLPVVISSGYTDTEIRARFAERPVAGFLQKPFRADALCAAVSAILSRDRAAVK